MSTLLVQNGLLIDTEWTRHSDVLVEGSKITRIAPHINPAELPQDTEIVHADGLCVLPGLIDAHTHYHLISRGTVTADSFVEGSRCAAFGGVTTVIDFADHEKNATLVESSDRRIDAMSKAMAVDFALHQGVYRWNDDIPAQLAAMKKNGVTTVKLFTTYKNVGYMIDREADIRALFSACKELQLQVSVHCEDDALIQEINGSWNGGYEPKDHADLRPSEVEYRGIKFVGTIAGAVGMPLYIVHLSSKRGLDAVRELRAEGVDLTVETTPHYLFLDRSKLEGSDGSLYVMTPPLRERADNLALQEALLNGEIQVVATDHCSFTREQKLSSHDCRTIYPGIPGTEELLPLVHTFIASSGKLSIQHVVNLLSTGPAKAFGIYPRKGALHVGSDADLVLFSPDESWTLDSHSVHTAAGYTPYEGMEVTGRVVMTYLRGRLIMGDHLYLGIPGDGRFVPESLPEAYHD